MANRNNDKGSRAAIIKFVNNSEFVELLNSEIKKQPHLQEFNPINLEWLSPLKNDSFREYQDDFLSKFELAKYSKKIREFWPKNGPVWDGLITAYNDAGAKAIILVEAKSYPGEMKSNMQATASKSIRMIKEAFRQTQKAIDIKDHKDWTSDYYQLANRIAFTYYLNNEIGIPTWLLLINFVNDQTYKPTDKQTWTDYSRKAFEKLGIDSTNNIMQRIIQIYPEYK